MPIDPSIALQAQAPQADNRLNALSQLLQFQQAAARNKLLEMQMQHAQATQPYEIAKLKAEADAIPALADTRRAQQLKAQIDAAKYMDEMQGRNRLLELLRTGGSQESNNITGVMLDENAARQAAIEANKRGESVNMAVPNPTTLRAAAIQANPKEGIDSLLKTLNPTGAKYGSATPGSIIYDRATGLPMGNQVPFRPNDPAPVIRVVPDANSPTGASYRNMRDPNAPAIAPAPPVAPPKDPKQTAAYQAGLREIQKDDALNGQINQLETALKRWGELNGGVTTGRIAGAINPGIMQPQFQELKQLENYLAVNNFKPGQGQISNYERGLIRGAGPSVSNDKETNDRIIQVQLGAVQNARDKNAFREWYLEQNGKLLGADREWNAYIEKNPRFKSGAKGAIVPNAEYKPWTDYFGVGGNRGEQAGSSTGSGNQVITPDGRTFNFPSPDAAAAFKRQAGIQ